MLFLFLSSGGRTRTYDLRVMSPTSYQLLYSAMYVLPRGVLIPDWTAKVEVIFQLCKFYFIFFAYNLLACYLVLYIYNTVSNFLLSHNYKIRDVFLCRVIELLL